eukprot:6087336-Ditylum_brightwellii.AAC.1
MADGKKQQQTRKTCKYLQSTSTSSSTTSRPYLATPPRLTSSNSSPTSSILPHPSPCLQCVLPFKGWPTERPQAPAASPQMP